MKRRLIAVLLGLTMILSNAQFVFAGGASDVPQIRNIIYMIPDGGGMAPFFLADHVKQAGGFDVTKYPTEIKRGSSFSLRGTISSSARISTIHGYILDASGDEVQSTKDTPNAKSVSIKSKNINKKLAFGKLSKGNYTLKIVVVDNDGNIGSWEKAFSVK